MSDDPLQFVELDDYADLIAEYQTAKTERDRAVAEVERLRDMIVKLLPSEEDAPEGCMATVGGATRVSYRPYVARVVNHQTLRDVYPWVHAACTQHVVRWTLRLVGGESE